MLQYLCGETIRMAKDSLAAGDWRAALTWWAKAAMYDDDQSTAKAHDADVPHGY
jgi:hypothetical protein